MKFGKGSAPSVRTPVPNFTFIGAKPIFGPLGKNNTGMAALRTGLPVKKTPPDGVSKYVSGFIYGAEW